MSICVMEIISLKFAIHITDTKQACRNNYVYMQNDKIARKKEHRDLNQINNRRTEKHGSPKIFTKNSALYVAIYIYLTIFFFCF